MTVLVLVLSQPDQRQAVVGSIGSGAFYAALALAIVLTFRATGVVNFAVGATAMYAGYVYNDVRHGSLFLPPLPNPLSLVEGVLHLLGADGVQLPDWPTTVSFGGPQSIGVAFAVAIVSSTILGGLLHLLVFRPLQHAPPLAKVVASVGLTLLLQAIVVLRFSSTAQSVAPIIEDRRILVGGVGLSLAQLVVAGIVVALTVGFGVVFRYTRTGLAIRASAENEGAAIVLGYSPNTLAGVSWVVSTLVAGTVGVLLSSINGSLDPSTMPLLIVPALGAALLGRFTSFGLAAVSAFALAMAQDWIQLLGTKDWFPRVGDIPLPGLTDALPLLVIIAVLVVKGRSLPGRDSLEPGRLPVAPPPIRDPRIAAALFVAVGISFFFIGPEWRVAGTNSITIAIVALSLVVVTGFAGQISLGQLAFAGVSGFALAKISAEIGLPMPIGLLLGATVATIFGVVFAFPALRIRGVSLAVVTLAAAVAIERFIFANPVWSGASGGAVLPAPRLFGVELGPNDSYQFGDQMVPNPMFTVACLVVLAGVVFLVNNVRRSPLGSHMLAVRTNERAAAAIGVDAPRTKIVAFALGAFIAGIGGALQGYGSGVVTPNQFGAYASVVVLAFAYFGGITSIGGAMIAGLLAPGGIASVPMQDILGADSDYFVLLAALGVVFNTIQAPEGVAGMLRAGWERRRWRPSSRGATEAGSPVDDKLAAEAVPPAREPVPHAGVRGAGG